MEVDRVAKLIAKDEIRDVLYGYAQAADRGDIDRLAQYYHPDAIDERPYNKTTDVPSFLAALRVMLECVQFVQHDISNPLIKVEGDYAESECFVSTRSMMDGPEGLFTYTSGARYLDKLERREGVWKFAHRRVVSTWSRTLADGTNEVIEKGTPQEMVSRVGPEDPGYGFFRLFRRGER